MAKGPDAFRTISEAAAEVGVPQHVLRFWETKFAFLRPMKGSGGRRFYRRQDLEVLQAVRTLLHERGYSIKAVQTLHKDHGVRGLLSAEPRVVAAPAAAPSSLALRPLAIGPAAEPAGYGPLGGSAGHRLQGVLADLEAVKARLDHVLSGAREP